MLLHINDDEYINSKDIVGIFNIKTLSKSDENKTLIDNIKNTENNTIVITNNKDSEFIYFSGISVATLSKRLNENKFV